MDTLLVSSKSTIQTENGPLPAGGLFSSAVSQIEQRLLCAREAMCWTDIHEQLDAIAADPALASALRQQLMELHQSVSLLDIRQRVVEVLSAVCGAEHDVQQFLAQALNESETTAEALKIITALAAHRESTPARKALEGVLNESPPSTLRAQAARAALT